MNTIKTIFNQRCLLWAGLLLTTLLGCSKSSTDPVTPADVGCQLTMINGQSSTGNAADQTIYTYDTKGLLVSDTQSNSLAGKAKDSSTKTYTYDADGYLTTDKYVYINGIGGYTNSQFTTYEYANGRLTKSSTVYSDDK